MLPVIAHPQSSLVSKLTVKSALAASALVLLSGCGGSSESSETNDGGTQAPRNYTVTAEFNDGGTVTPEQQTVQQGQSTTFEITTDSGYEVMSASGCGGELSDDIYTTGTIHSDCTVTIEFDLRKVTVTSQVIGEGQVIPESLEIEYGGSGQMDLVPDEGYQLKGADGCPGYLQEDSYIFEDHQLECELVVEFMPLFTVDTAVTGQGTVHPKSQLGASDDQLTFELEPDEYYRIGEVKGCPGELKEKTFVTDPLEASCTLEVNFEHALIAETWIIPDLEEEYGQMCDWASIFLVLPVNLNDNGYKDLFVHYWCPAGEFQEYSNSPTPDGLVALQNNGDGTFDVVTEEVFGQSHVPLGGHARNYDRGDLTGNGLDDFAFAMNWEDGRTAEDGMTNATEPTVVIALEKGKYEVVRLGDRSWGHGVTIVPNLEGGNDALFAGFVGGGMQGFRYSAGQWLNVSDEYPQKLQGFAGSARSIPRGLLDDDSAFAVGSGSGPDYLSLDFWKRDSTGWSLVDQFRMEIAQVIQQISWQGSVGEANMVELDGQLYLGGAIHEICFAEALDEQGTPGVVARIAMARHEELTEFDDETIYDQNDFVPVSKKAVFAISEAGLKQFSNPIINEHDEVNSNFIHCRDLNNNGLTDIVAYGYSDGSSEYTDGGRPLLYLNNGEGKFEFRPFIDIPVHSHLHDPGMTNRYQGRMYDMNGDGIEDILLFGTTTDFGSGEFQIHILREPFVLEGGSSD